MYTCQCEGCMEQSSGVLFKEVSAFQRCPLIEVSLYSVCIKQYKMCDIQWTLLSTRLLIMKFGITQNSK